MKILLDEKSKILAEQNGWTFAYAQGCVEGETSRRLGKSPSLHALVGIDEYSLGFRAAYFDRHHNEAGGAQLESVTRGAARVSVR